jgi:hypothetical protein
MLHAPDWVSPSPSTVVADGEAEGTHDRGPGDGDRGGAVGYRRRSELGEIGARLAPLHPKNNTFPGEVLLELAADAIAESGASRERPLEFEGIRNKRQPPGSPRRLPAGTGAFRVTLIERRSRSLRRVPRPCWLCLVRCAGTEA